MTRKLAKGSNGFTLIELMIVVAIIGILASIAIPSFLNYQLTSKRAEAFANLSALSKAQKAYFAEFNDYVSVVAEPLGATGQGPTTEKRDKSGIDAAFTDVGWVPDGDVYFDYDTVTPAGDPGMCAPCVDGCFTAAAYGDLDGDGALSVFLFAHPDAAGNFCTTWLGSNQSPPVVNGTRQLDQVARAIGADDF